MFMKVKVVVFVFFVVAGLASCKKQPCPAYGKNYQKIEKKNFPA
jgi:hypothetical protein